MMDGDSNSPIVIDSDDEIERLSSVSSTGAALSRSPDVVVIGNSPHRSPVNSTAASVSTSVQESMIVDSEHDNDPRLNINPLGNSDDDLQQVTGQSSSAAVSRFPSDGRASAVSLHEPEKVKEVPQSSMDTRSINSADGRTEQPFPGQLNYASSTDVTLTTAITENYLSAISTLSSEERVTVNADVLRYVIRLVALICQTLMPGGGSACEYENNLYRSLIVTPNGESSQSYSQVEDMNPSGQIQRNNSDNTLSDDVVVIQGTKEVVKVKPNSTCQESQPEGEIEPPNCTKVRSLDLTQSGTLNDESGKPVQSISQTIPTLGKRVSDKEDVSQYPKKKAKLMEGEQANRQTFDGLQQSQDTNSTTSQEGISEVAYVSG